MNRRTCHQLAVSRCALASSCLLLLSILFASFVLAIQSVAQQDPSPDHPGYIVEKDVAVPMRDGVTLRADVLRPQGSGPFPVLLYRTPYGKEEALKEYTTFRRAVERGYAMVVQDVRGRYASSGEFVPYQQEGHDGFDSIEWAARQPWSNGEVGTFGLSYPGAVQWLAAVENPPHLKAMVPAMTFSTAQNFFYAGGMWDMSWIDWIWDNIAPDVRAKKNIAGPKTYKAAIDAWREAGPRMQNELPLSDLSELKGIAPYYYEWLKHPYDDPWWDWCELRNKYDRVHAAVLNFSGWYDDNYGPEGATTNLIGLLKARSRDRDPRTHLMIGPWVHGVDATARTTSGQREFGKAAVIDYDEVVLRWMDHYVKGINNGVEHENPVRYFVMGLNEWRDAKTWPPPGEEKIFYIAPAFPNSGQEPGKKVGLLSADVPKQSGSNAFISDPANPVRNAYGSSGAHDYRELSSRDDVLTYDSPALESDLESTGPIRANIFFSCDCRDTDIWVRLLDVTPDGTALNLMSPGLDVLRASYRDVNRGRQLLTPNKIYELQLTNLITSNVFVKGHRIRIQISATFFPNFSRNLHTGELESTSAQMQKATIRIYHDRKHPSRITLPAIPELSSR